MPDPELDFAVRLTEHASAVYDELRPAQAFVLEAYAAHHLSTPDLAVELPTGVGKTLIALLIADLALDRGWSVAYLTATRQLAEQVELQAQELSQLTIHRFSGGNYPGARLHDYHQAQAVGVMNYWVYFNTSPVVQPADLLILDDAHVAEQPLTGLASLRIAKRRWSDLYRSICEVVASRSSAYATLQSMRDDTAPPYTPPELLAFNDWMAVSDSVAMLIQDSEFAASPEGRYVWPVLRGGLTRCGVLIGPAGIEIRPYHPPTQSIPGYAEARQRLYLSATLGTMDDLQRRLGTKVIERIDVPSDLRREQTGQRTFLINPTESASLSTDVLEFAFGQSERTNHTAWLCSSNLEADSIAAFLLESGQDVFRLRQDDEAALDRWLDSESGHLVTAGRFDGLDFAGDACRLVVIPSVPAASSEFERFIMAYLGDASFMRHRIGQRVTQALGRANREDADWAIYLGLDPGFGTVLADPTVNTALGEDIRPTIRLALEYHGQGWGPVLGAADAAWTSGSSVRATPPIARRPGRAARSIATSGSSDAEVSASTALWLGDFARSAQHAREAAQLLMTSGETEHSAFWTYVAAHALWERGRPADLTSAAAALREVVDAGPRTSWFVRLRRTLDEIEERALDPAGHDGMFLSWEDWIRELGSQRISTEISRIRRNLNGSHDERADGLLVLARLCGATAHRPEGTAAADCIWTWVTPTRTHHRTWEIKTGTAPDAVPRSDVNQILGQVQVQRGRSPRAKVFACLMTPMTEVEESAAQAAHDDVAILNNETIVRLADLLVDRLRTYLTHRGSGTAEERGTAREHVESRLPGAGWLARVLAPSQGTCRMPDFIDSEFPAA